MALDEGMSNGYREGVSDTPYYAEPDGSSKSTPISEKGALHHGHAKLHYSGPRGPGLYEGRRFRRSAQTILGLHTKDWQILAGILVVAVFVRLHRISQPSSVVFDEVHFGGFASKYIKGKFFVDVHPPLAKLLITLAGIMGGYKGNFGFTKIGDDYLEPGVPYVTMRLLPAIMGIMLVPISYVTMKLSGFTTTASTLVALMITFENGLVTQSRFILLDSTLLCFAAFSVLAWINFNNEAKRPFTIWWWTWLALTGAGLGLTVSCKWVGLFTVALIGLSTIKQLWLLLGDLRVTPAMFVMHFMARALCLIVIPIALYMLFFAIHFAILTNTGDGSGYLSPEFQHTLAGNSIQDTPIDIAYGSEVTIKHLGTHGGYLHSHKEAYPGGSKQQQVTLYPHKDDNNFWIIQNRTDDSDSKVTWIRNGDVIRLLHVDTVRRLHSHDVRPPITDVEYHNEVSGYGYEGFPGDDNDLWRVEIVDHDKSDPESNLRLRTIHTRFRLVHVASGCYLFSHSVKLPEWGFGQQEVTCIKDGKYPRTIWYIESNSNPILPKDAETVNYRKIGFLEKFFEINKVMWHKNARLTSSHPYESRPASWPLLIRPISFWSKNHRHIHLVGNPFIWWSSTMAIALWSIGKVIIILRSKRGYMDHLNSTKEFYESNADFFFLGWLLHWVPFFLMERQLFLHHYFPSLYFAILLFGVGFDVCVTPFKSQRRVLAAAVLVLVYVYVFTMFRPMAYGDPWIRSECKRAVWMKTWQFNCRTYRTTYDEVAHSSADGSTSHIDKSESTSQPVVDKARESPTPASVSKAVVVPENVAQPHPEAAKGEDKTMARNPAANSDGRTPKRNGTGENIGKQTAATKKNEDGNDVGEDEGGEPEPEPEPHHDEMRKRDNMDEGHDL